jgi:hypothetical protein
MHTHQLLIRFGKHVYQLSGHPNRLVLGVMTSQPTPKWCSGSMHGIVPHLWTAAAMEEPVSTKWQLGRSPVSRGIVQNFTAAAARATGVPAGVNNP